MTAFMTKLKNKLLEERGVSTIEVILILVVFIALVLLFKNQILGLVETIFGHIRTSVDEVY